MPRRRKDRKDNNQTSIAEALKKLGFSVELDMDDILVGKHGYTFWFEIKSEDSVSKKTGEILDSAKKPHQKELEREWKGHYKIVSSLEEILEDIREQLH